MARRGRDVLVLRHRVVSVLPGRRSTPFTFWYLVVLATTTLVLRLAPPMVVQRLLAASSTSAANLDHHPMRVLVASALWLSDPHWLVYAVIFTAVLAPLERHVGTLWALLVFASGHVFATLATELPVQWAVRFHLLPLADGHLLDIGVSYGLAAAAGALALMLPTPARWWAVGVLNASILAIYLAMGPADLSTIVTALGHLVAAYVGMLGWLPWLRSHGLVGSLARSPESRGPESHGRPESLPSTS